MRDAFNPNKSATFCEPVLSANIYAAGLLDDLIAKAIAPFWREARNLLGEHFMLWLVRYSRGGEHLKVRVHGDPQHERVLKERLTDHVSSYLDKVRSLPPAPQGATLFEVPAIDPEDEITALFSVIYGVLLRPLSFRAPDHIVVLTTTCVNQTESIGDVSGPDFADWRDRSSAFEVIAACAVGEGSAIV